MRGLLTFLLLLELASTLVFQLSGSVSALYLAAACIGSFLVLRASAINLTGRALLAITLGSVVLAFAVGAEAQVFLTGLKRATLFAGFMVAMGFLKVAAKNSDLIAKCSHLIINQRPAIRYGMLSYGSTLMGVILSFGTINLVGQMINDGNTLKAAAGDKRIHSLRLKRMGMALHRGFSAIPMASPFSITMVLLLGSIPGLSWTTLVPLSFSFALVLIALGWAVDFLGHRGLTTQTQLTFDRSLSWRPAFLFLCLVLGLFCTAATLSQVFGGSLPMGIMVAAPLFGLAWLYRAVGGLQAFKDALKSDLPDAYVNLPSEVAIICAAGIVGVVLSSFIQHDQLLTFVEITGLSGIPLAFLGMGVVLACAFVGIGPMISVSVVASTLSHLPALGLSPYVLAIAMLGAWVMSMNIAPIGLCAVLVGNAIHLSPRKLTVEWNLTYTLMAMLLCVGAVYGLQALHFTGF